MEEDVTRIHIESNNRRGQEVIAAAIDTALIDAGFDNTTIVCHTDYPAVYVNDEENAWDQLMSRNPSFFKQKVEICLTNIKEDAPPDNPAWVEPVTVEHPMQPVVLDDHGTPRFLQNCIVKDLSDGMLNEIALGEYSQKDREQLAQLIGYSVSGFGTLSYARKKTVVAADEYADALLSEVDYKHVYKDMSVTDDRGSK